MWSSPHSDTYPGYEDIIATTWIVDYTKPLGGLEALVNDAVLPRSKSHIWDAYRTYVAPLFEYRLEQSKVWQARIDACPDLRDFVTPAYRPGSQASIFWAWSKIHSEVNCERCGGLIVPVDTSVPNAWTPTIHYCDALHHSVEMTESGFSPISAPLSSQSFAEPFVARTTIPGAHRTWVPAWWYKRYWTACRTLLPRDQVFGLLDDLAIARASKDEQAEALALLAIDLALE